MPHDVYDRVFELFTAVVELDADRRRAFLDSACRRDEPLRRDVESLLAEHDSDKTPKGRHRSNGRPGARSDHPRTVGGYRITRVIGAGGMGTVYEATQEHPHRIVALKLMNPGVVSASTLRRFRYESDVLARLQHPGIAHVYDAGTYDDGSCEMPYFAMEYVADARPITEYAREHRLSRRERLLLFVKVCAAVQHGHQRGVIHRDLKPANILVDPPGLPKIIDFGVACADRADAMLTASRTSAGQVVGTLQYMSPEQCDGDAPDVDTRGDVYALGLVLFELLCGRLPYDLSGVSIHKAVYVIREEPPTRPRIIDRSLRGDLETILLKALQKDRDLRYDSASALAEDVTAHLESRPLPHARPPSALHQASALIRRHKLPAALVAMLFVLATVFGIWMSVLYARTRHLADQSNLARAALFVSLDKVVALSATDNPSETRRAIDEFTSGVEEALAGHPLEQAGFFEACGRFASRVDDYREAERLQLKALDLRRRAVGDGHPLVIGSLFMLADIRAKRGDWRNSLASCEEALAAMVADDPTEGLEYRRARFIQVEPLLGLGRYVEAEAIIRDVLDLDRTDGTWETRDAALRLDLLAAARLLQGDFDDAESLFRQVLVHPATARDAMDRARVQARLAGVLWIRGDFETAEGMLRDSLAIMREYLGERHRVVLATSNSIGVCLRDQGRLDEAERILRRVLALSRQTHGVEHPYSMNPAVNLAWTLLARGDLAEAETLFDEVLRVRTAALGEGHADVAEPLLGLGSIRLDLGRADEALPLFERARAIIGAHLTESHWRYAEATVRLGACVARLDERARARALLADGMAGLERSLGPDHPKCAAARLELARLEARAD